ncbi:MAG: PIG-L family deacetylase [Eubacteriales bacterium]|nr:PIG-L family deacetylase [Eubacteriales bacterium]
MGSHIYIDIINFILSFLLVDFLNGEYSNYLGKKLKSGVLTLAVMVIFALAFSASAMFFLFTKIALLVALVIAFIALLAMKTSAKRLCSYTDVEAGKEEFFSSKKVMVLVPHEDDDLNLMGGVIEQYIKHGSDIYVVFATNGDGDRRFDMSKMGYTRMNEAIEALGFLGVPEKNVIFLGYGDGWGENGPHIYNAEPEIELSSTAGRTATYGLSNHPAYNEGRKYTRSNFIDDIKEVILDYKPDDIFCVDYDTHIDHRALSMIFEKTIGSILKTTDYKPNIYKGYAYRTAWGSAPDFSDSINLNSTVSCPASNDVVLYDWNSRVRLPVDIQSVSRDIQNSKLYKALSLYSSQRALECADRIINGDKVFWLRRTDSLLYNAEIKVSSGDKSKLTDFMLLDCDDLVGHGDKPYDGVWHPEMYDEEKSIYVTFNEKQYIESIVLYDNPSPTDNILNAVITLDDGSEINTAELNHYGDATVICINKEIKSFVVKIDKYEGDHFGLSEIEAYCSQIHYIPHLYKLTDDKDNFIYDNIVPITGRQAIKVYSNYQEIFTSDKFVLRSSNSKCKIELTDERITLKCPRGQKCQVELLSKDDKLLDRVIFRNPGKISRYCLAHSLKYKKNKSYCVRVFNLVRHKICGK